MTKIWNEEQITLENLAAHLRDSGVIPTAVAEDGIWLHTPSGTAYRVSILEDKKFVRIGTYLPLDQSRTIEDKLAFEHQLNSTIFMASVSIDDDEDLTVSYVLPYQCGLIAGQLIAIVNRFSSLLEYIVQSRNSDGIIRFSSSQSEDNSDTPTVVLDTPADALLH
jgi:hypothetical protein